MASNHAHASVHGKGELTQAETATGASGALTGREALLASLGGDVLSSKIKALSTKWQHMLAEEKAAAKALNNREIGRRRKPIISAQMTWWRC